MPLKEQTSGLTRQQPIQRQSLVTSQQYTRQQRPPTYTNTRTTQQPRVTEIEIEEDDTYYTQPSIRSSLRHRPISLDWQLAPAQPVHTQTQRHTHPLVFVGIAMFIMIIGWIAITALGSFWQLKQDDFNYGNPRTFQTDANVGHGSAQNPMSHFIAVNYNDQIIVIEFPAGDTSKARIYPITTLSQGSEHTPVTLTFRDITTDGKVDMLIQIGEDNSGYTVFLFNNGIQFVSKL